MPRIDVDARQIRFDWMGTYSCSCCLQFCRPVHLWSSRRRCLAQKWPSQNEQSPTIRRGVDEQVLKEQRFFDGPPPRNRRTRLTVAPSSTAQSLSEASSFSTEPEKTRRCIEAGKWWFSCKFCLTEAMESDSLASSVRTRDEKAAS